MGLVMFHFVLSFAFVDGRETGGHLQVQPWPSLGRYMKTNTWGVDYTLAHCVVWINIFFKIQYVYMYICVYMRVCVHRYVSYCCLQAPGVNWYKNYYVFDSWYY